MFFFGKTTKENLLDNYTPTPRKIIERAYKDISIFILIFALALAGCDDSLIPDEDIEKDLPETEVPVTPPSGPKPPINTHWYTKNPNASTFYISTADELAELAQIVNRTHDTIRPFSNFEGKTISLLADIDLSAYGEDFNGSKGWIPIGYLTTSASFRGTFNGMGRKITGLYIDNDQLYTGLFGYIDGGSVENLGIIDADIKGAGYTGGIVGGIANGGTVRNCYTTGSITGSGNNVGGIVGSVVNGTVSNCYSTGNVTGNSQNVGGIAGNITNSTVSNCYVTGAVSGTVRTGGVTGYNNSSTVQNCAALNPSVKGSGFTGRVSGDSATLINNCAFINMGTAGGVSFSGGNGADITKGEIAADGTIGGRFTTSANGWTAQNGRLPGLFGGTVELPLHLRQ
jgi:hypothetical protein